MKKKTPVSEIMSKDIISVQENHTLKQVDKTLKNWHIRHVPVLNNKKVVGMLSQTDLQKVSFINTMDGDAITKALYNELTVSQVMTTHVKTVQATDTIRDVAIELATNEFHALPVCKGEEVVGIVTSTDLIKYLIDQY
jgi:CBS domain-containing membrane protein